MAGKLTSLQLVLAAGMLITGSVNTLSKKAQNDCNVSYSFSGHQAHHHKFDHPWFQTLVMFTGESLCLIGFAIQRTRENRKLTKEQVFSQWSYSDGTEVSHTRPPVFHWIFILPTLCDLTGTTLAGIGLVVVNASVWQMFRGSLIVFTGVLSVLFLKRRLKCFHWVGILIVVFGLCLVGLSDIYEQDQSNSSWKLIIGILLIVAGQLANAVQMVVEETFLKKRGFPPLQVVGMEGLFGVILTAGVVMPVLYHININGKPYEDGLDAFYQMISSKFLLGMILLYLTSIIFYNYFGLAVTKSLTAVHRTLIDALRTIVIWVVELVIYYAGAESFGEGFSWWSLVQFDGFLFLLMGTLLYYEVVEVACLGSTKTATERIRESLKNGPHDDMHSLLGGNSNSREYASPYEVIN